VRQGICERSYLARTQRRNAPRPHTGDHSDIC
jgi:hypothetical protein